MLLDMSEDSIIVSAWCMMTIAYSPETGLFLDTLGSLGVLMVMIVDFLHE